jgi:hypothetical protein
MRTLLPAITFTLLALGARASNADKATVVVDCKTAITLSTVGGIGIRVVTGGAISECKRTSMRCRRQIQDQEPTLVSAVNVKYGMKPMNNTVAMNIVSEDAATKFQLVVKKAKTAGGENTASFEKTEPGPRSSRPKTWCARLRARSRWHVMRLRSRPRARRRRGRMHGWPVEVRRAAARWLRRDQEAGGLPVARGRVYRRPVKCGELPKACDAATKPRRARAVARPHVRPASGSARAAAAAPEAWWSLALQIATTGVEAGLAVVRVVLHASSKSAAP